MTIEDILNDARSVVKKVVPDHVEITQVDFEGPTIVIYTKNMEVFAESNDLVRQIAQQLRRRIVVRPDPSLLASQERFRPERDQEEDRVGPEGREDPAHPVEDRRGDPPVPSDDQ